MKIQSLVFPAQRSNIEANATEPIHVHARRVVFCPPPLAGLGPHVNPRLVNYAILKVKLRRSTSPRVAKTVIAISPYTTGPPPPSAAHADSRFLTYSARLPVARCNRDPRSCIRPGSNSYPKLTTRLSPTQIQLPFPFRKSLLAPRVLLLLASGSLQHSYNSDDHKHKHDTT